MFSTIAFVKSTRAIGWRRRTRPVRTSKRNRASKLSVCIYTRCFTASPKKTLGKREISKNSCDLRVRLRVLVNVLREISFFWVRGDRRLWICVSSWRNGRCDCVGLSFEISCNYLDNYAYFEDIWMRISFVTFFSSLKPQNPLWNLQLERS